MLRSDSWLDNAVPSVQVVNQARLWLPPAYRPDVRSIHHICTTLLAGSERLQVHDRRRYEHRFIFLSRVVSGDHTGFSLSGLKSPV